MLDEKVDEIIKSMSHNALISNIRNTKQNNLQNTSLRRLTKRSDDKKNILYVE